MKTKNQLFMKQFLKDIQLKRKADEVYNMKLNIFFIFSFNHCLDKL